MNPILRHFVRFQFPAFLWAGVIYYASSLPAYKLPKFALMINDKVIHAVIFFILGLFVYRALESRVKTSEFSWKRVLVALFAVIIYGLMDEFHQSFVPGRSVDLKDATADAIGGILSAAVVYIFWLRKRTRSE